MTRVRILQERFPYFDSRDDLNENAITAGFYLSGWQAEGLYSRLST